ncbi:MAG: hypothetical protein U0132_07345 [Gemmatimonadaceae bacterium]
MPPESAVFDDIKDAFRDLLSGRVAPEERRAFLHSMRESLALARVSVDEMRDAVASTRRRLQHERTELETVLRRKTLAEGINDAETVAIAARFESQHVAKIAALEKKLDGGEAELSIAEAEVAEMMDQLKAANAGVGSGMRPGAASSPDGGSTESAELEREIDSVGRAQRRAALDADADARLAELKKKMGM